MAIIVNPKESAETFLAEIVGITKTPEVKTWSVDTDGDFTHTPPQWKFEAWFRPRVEGGQLIFAILSPKGKVMSSSVYAVYHGRFIEMLLQHFDLKFKDVYATALPARGDITMPPA